MDSGKCSRKLPFAPRGRKFAGACAFAAGRIIPEVGLSICAVVSVVRQKSFGEKKNIFLRLVTVVIYIEVYI